MHAIVGCGRVAINHVDALDAINQKIKYACDISEETARQFGSKFGILNSTTSIDSILHDDDVQAVSICTPHNTHAELTLKCLTAGKHVIVEKPIALDLEDANEMLATAEKVGSVLCVISQHRYDLLAQEIRNIVDEGELGQISLITGNLQCSKDPEYYSDESWRGKRYSEGGSSLINQGIHTLDQMICLAGKPKVVSATTSTMKFEGLIETEETIAAIMNFPNGAVGVLSCTNSSTIEWKSSIEIVGTKGSIGFTTGFPVKLTTLNIDSENNEKISKRLKNIQSQRPPAPAGQSYYGTSHREQIKDFYDAVGSGTNLEMHPIDAVVTLETVLDIYNSATQVKRI